MFNKTLIELLIKDEFVIKTYFNEIFNLLNES